MGPDGDYVPGIERLPGTENGGSPLKDATELVAALAAYFGCEPGQITGWVVACERTEESGLLTLSTGWGAPAAWRVIGFVDELRDHIERQR